MAFSELKTHFPPDEYHVFIGIQLARNRADDGNIGENCFVFEDTAIQPFITIGNNVVLWSGSHVGHRSKIFDQCFVAPHVTIAGGVTIGESCFIGVNARRKRI